MDRNLLEKKLFIFDMGDVVIKGIRVVEKTALALGLDPELFAEDVAHYSYPMMDGEISIKQYYAHAERVFGKKFDSDPLKSLFTPYLNEPMARVLEKLRKECPGSRIVCGTNTHDEHWSVVCGHGWDKFFDKCYCSHLIHLTKPFPVFYSYILEHEGVAARDAFFIDDYAVNIQGAKSIGLDGLLYDDDTKLAEVFGI